MRRLSRVLSAASAKWASAVATTHAVLSTVAAANSTSPKPTNRAAAPTTNVAVAVMPPVVTA